MGIEPEFHGAPVIAGQLAGKAHAARIAWIDGAPGGVWAHRGEVLATFGFTIENGQIQEIWLRADSKFLETSDIEIEPAPKRRTVSA
jgi:RNA polymerase sigma-70 factor (ECF subfamily)